MHLVLGFILFSTKIFSFFDNSLVFYSVIRVNFGEPGDWCDAFRNGIQLNWGRSIFDIYTTPDMQSRGKQGVGGGAGWDSQHMQRDWWMRMQYAWPWSHIFTTLLFILLYTVIESRLEKEYSVGRKRRVISKRTWRELKLRSGQV